MKICQIYNMASHYRKAIFRLMDSVFDTDFVFGILDNDIQKLDYSLLSGKVYEVKTNWWKNIVYYQYDILKFLYKKYDKYIITGDIRNLSVWFFLLCAKFYSNKEVYLWTHGWYGREGRLKCLIKKLFFKLADGLFLYGNYAKELMIREGFNEKKLFVVHNSLDYEKHIQIRRSLRSTCIYKNYFKNEYPNLIFIGRLTKVKKLNMILEAMYINKRKGIEFNMTFIGQGECIDALRKQAFVLDLENNIWFFGATYDERLIGELIYNADLCVSPGNVGLTAIHSLTFGTPIITHNDFSNQMPEFEAIHEGITGSYFEFDNVSSLASKIETWIDQQKDRENIRKKCYDEIDNFWTPDYQLAIFRSVLE